MVQHPFEQILGAGGFSVGAQTFHLFPQVLLLERFAGGGQRFAVDAGQLGAFGQRDELAFAVEGVEPPQVALGVEQHPDPLADATAKLGAR